MVPRHNDTLHLSSSLFTSSFLMIPYGTLKNNIYNEEETKHMYCGCCQCLEYILHDWYLGKLMKHEGMSYTKVSTQLMTLVNLYIQ
jgi:hypothetical protein